MLDSPLKEARLRTQTVQKTVIESLESVRKSSATKVSQAKNSQNDLRNVPEIQAQIKEMMKKHWENWFDEPIPVLEYQTPRQAAKTKKGRELLDVLLLQYESHDRKRNDNLLKADIPYIKAELGLEDYMV